MESDADNGTWDISWMEMSEMAMEGRKEDGKRRTRLCPAQGAQKGF